MLNFNNKIFILLPFSVLVSSESVIQYVGLAPTSGLLSWKEVSFPLDYAATSASEVSISNIRENVDVLGSWQNLNLNGTTMLTIRTFEDKLFTQVNVGISGQGPEEIYPGGCCVDKFRIFDKINVTNDNITDDVVVDQYIEWDISSIICDIFENITDIDPNTNKPFAYANHMFDITQINGIGNNIAILDVTYHEPLLDYAEIDAVVLFNTDSGEVVPTKDGDLFFSFYRKLGTNSTETVDGIYKISFTNPESSAPDDEQFHLNGITRFQTFKPLGIVKGNKHKMNLHEDVNEEDVNADDEGTWILASSFLYLKEAILIKCPYTYLSSQGGGTILQRFGTPTNHTFGLLSSEGRISGLHNVYHTNYPNNNSKTATTNDDDDDDDLNSETITLFINSQEGYLISRIIEFEIKLTPEPMGEIYNDSIFNTTYISGNLDYSTYQWGGARPIGQGVWLAGYEDISVVDVNSNNPPSSSLLHGETNPLDHASRTLRAETTIYDCFSFVNA